jgi:hypothetical protein
METGNSKPEIQDSPPTGERTTGGERAIRDFKDLEVWRAARELRRAPEPCFSSFEFLFSSF